MASSSARQRVILVPIANPRSALPLLRCAAPLAGRHGALRLLTVLDTDCRDEDVRRAHEGLEAAVAAGRGLEMAVTGEVHRATDAAQGVLEAIELHEPSLVVMGWQGTSSTSDIFGRLIDRVVGRSKVPLAVVRLGRPPLQRIVLPISAEHLLPGGNGSLCLATDLARRLGEDGHLPISVLRTGSRTPALPTDVAALGDRVHHDPRRAHKAVEAFAAPSDVIVAAVAPTASGLRNATTHLAWAAPDATLVVALDVGPVADHGLVAAVADAGTPGPPRREVPLEQQRIVVTIRAGDTRAVDAAAVESVLNTVGTTDLVMSWWPAEDDRTHIAATVTIPSVSANRAMALVMTAVHEAPALAGAEISYELEHDPAPVRRRVSRTIERPSVAR